MFDSEITTESIESLISKITEDVTIYFDSKGGSAIVADYFVDFTKRTEHKITLITNWGVKSCAFNIFLMSKTKKIVLDSGFGICHLVNRDVNTTDIVKNDELTKFLLGDIDIVNKRLIEFYERIGIRNEQISEYQKGEDVFIEPKQLKEMAILAEQIMEESK
jgi:hypothetical protein